MKKLSSSVTVVLMVLGIFLGHILLAPSSASGAWKDRSGDLPDDNNSTTTALVIIGAAIVVGVVLYFVVFKGSKAKADDPGDKEDDAEDSEDKDSQSSLIDRPGLDGISGNGLLSNVGLYVNLDHEPASETSTIALRAPGLADYTLKVGFTLGL